MIKRMEKKAVTRISRRLILLVLLLLILASECSPVASDEPSNQGSDLISGSSLPPLKAAEVIISVIPPEDTPMDADLALVIIDEVTGLTYNNHSLPMKRLNDGRWQISFTPSVGSLLRYRYTRLEPSPADEMTAEGLLVPYRVVHIPGPIQIDDIIAAWADIPYQGSIGRINGRITDAETGQPLPEIIVTASGVTDFTDGEGSFRLDGLPPGLHNLVVFSPDGAYHTVQQGAIVAAESLTPVELGLMPAQAVIVTFEVIVPSDTPLGSPVRIAGNVQQLGNVFSELAGGLSVSIDHMPTLILIDSTHFLTVITLYAGTDLHYKYSLGDGLWNAEHDSDGFFNTRHVIVPDHDLVIKDTVFSWRGGDNGNFNFHLTVPENTPPSDYLSIQMKSFDWLEPLPMWPLGNNEWFYTILSPTDFSEHLEYRYCRNSQCGSADDADTAGTGAVGRQLTSKKDAQDLVDEVTSWQWSETDPPNFTVVEPEIPPRSDFIAGVSFLPAYKPNWMMLNAEAMSALSDLGANAVNLTPTWMLARNNPTPIIAFNPAYAPFSRELQIMNADALRSGLQVTLRPSLRPTHGEIDTWWLESTRDSPWWDVWFEEYRSFILTYARQAQMIGASTLVIGGPEIAPALPEGQLSDGTPSGCPSEAEALWERLIKEIRARFSGEIAFEIDLGAGLQRIPIFIDAFDLVHIYWHAPLTDSDSATISDMQTAAGAILDDTILVHPELKGKPIILNVEYLSVTGSAKACAMAPDRSCRIPSEFDQGAVVDQDLELDLLEQAYAINAVLLEAYSRSEVIGFYIRGYNPTVSLLDKSASVNGKPAQDVLWRWYQHMTE
jgi:hypothetical protein